MDLNEALSIVELAIERSSQNMVARAIQVDPSVLSRWRKQTTVPQGETKARIIRYAEDLQRHRLSGTRGRVRETPKATTVEQAITVAQHEQAKWIREFAARVLEASARELRAASANQALGAFVTAAELDGDERDINDMQDVATGKKKRKTS